jgi:hypothetical protein
LSFTKPRFPNQFADAAAKIRGREALRACVLRAGENVARARPVMTE